MSYNITSPVNKPTQSRNEGTSRKRVNHPKMYCIHGHECKFAPVALNIIASLIDKKGPTDRLRCEKWKALLPVGRKQKYLP